MMLPASVWMQADAAERLIGGEDSYGEKANHEHQVRHLRQGTLPATGRRTMSQVRRPESEPYCSGSGGGDREGEGCEGTRQEALPGRGRTDAHLPNHWLDRG